MCTVNSLIIHIWLALKIRGEYNNSVFIYCAVTFKGRMVAIVDEYC